MSDYGPWTNYPRSAKQRRRGELRREQHVREAREFTEEMGGADQEVKRYFFSLDSRQLREILREYGRRYGWQAREYAEMTFPAWRSGRRRMSGMVAKRLFELIPPRMPVADKLSLAEGLWRYKGPRSHRTITVGPRDDVDAVIRQIADHVERTVIRHRIPQDLERRFNWLSDGDVDVKQMLLNHVEQMEKALVVEGARRQLPVMLKHLRADGGFTIRRLAQVLKIGNHEIEVRLEADPAESPPLAPVSVPLDSVPEWFEDDLADSRPPEPSPAVPSRVRGTAASSHRPPRASQEPSHDSNSHRPLRTAADSGRKKKSWRKTIILLACMWAAYFLLSNLPGR
ncbi:MAG: hypothetical protein OXH52_12340 [Gammaproteobacteria bacterium]|nr:hypothetical protein [Gammaproteobacteria bacterium]